MLNSVLQKFEMSRSAHKHLLLMELGPSWSKLEPWALWARVHAPLPGAPPYAIRSNKRNTIRTYLGIYKEGNSPRKELFNCTEWKFQRPEEMTSHENSSFKCWSVIKTVNPLWFTTVRPKPCTINSDSNCPPDQKIVKKLNVWNSLLP